LTPLTFDLPLPYDCSIENKTNACKVEKALEPHRKEIEGRAPKERFLYKALNNGNIFVAAISSLRKNEKSNSVFTESETKALSIEEELEYYRILKEIAYIKIKNNPLDYMNIVVMNSYYSVKIWGDWYKHDNLGEVSKEGIKSTNKNADAIKLVSRVIFDPTLDDWLPNHFYKDYIFQTPRLILNGHFVSDFLLIILAIGFFYIIKILHKPSTLLETIAFSCFIFIEMGVVFQNSIFPVIPRLLAPFQPLGALAILIIIFNILGIFYVKLKYIRGK
jgi:hypothetical protein